MAKRHHRPTRRGRFDDVPRVSDFGEAAWFALDAPTALLTDGETVQSLALAIEPRTAWGGTADGDTA